MTLNAAEAGEAVIRRFQTTLGRAEILPGRSLRRNSAEYPLVCSMNNVTALFLSENWEGVSIFVSRAAEHMIARPADSQLPAYCELASACLSQIVHHLTVHVGGIEFGRERIPSVIIHAGPQSGPG